MTQVDFYILESPQAEACAQFACRLAEKAWRQGHRVHIHTAAPEQSRQLDELLWRFREPSFVPHSLAPADLETPIHIGHDELGVSYHDVLINLAPDVPLFFSQFERVAELVGHAPQQRQQGRQRFTFYRDRGYALHTHTIASGTAS